MTAIQTFLTHPGTYILGFFITVIFLKEIWTIRDWFCERFGIQTKNTLRQKEVDDKMNQYDNRLVSLEETVNKELEEDKQIAGQLNNLTDMVSNMQERHDEATRSRLKDRIGECYRHYHVLGRWNAMEKDAFEDLIKSYEQAGGSNSFIHKVCQPESYTWKLVDEVNPTEEEIQKLSDFTNEIK